MAENYNQRWPVIQDILRREGIARQHLTSFDEFLDNGLQSIIHEVGQIEIENAEYPYKIQLGKIKLQQPRMMELRWFYYSCNSCRSKITKYFLCCTNYDGSKCC